ncbi:MAG: RNA methyltransferase [Candidatus Omnitrophica bacterium]|nr:RNA methyltransferase [Candidatus Omnitrophota bacterium]MBU1127844.1 RNA methyltransferase [Candidatus Omnitrophota bacterium]MBU1656812.1 RNA methyltransferase [Candidatus Omnitrophota bacterium]MBU1784913.1 RNA methyltransferase [Candidatus Omnitrophota bacterium]MBU1852085.1 RNA methyltransferase [Candidatus Omnitrophota bacterium]
MRLFGKKPVLERIKTDPGSITALYLRQKVQLALVVNEAKRAGLTFESVPSNEFSRLCGDVNAQGVMAEVKEYSYTPLPVMLKDALKEKKVLVFVDGVTDPQNFGSMIRNLACLGGFSLIIPEHESVCVNETVLRVACGGENYITIAKVVNSVRGILAAKEKGFYCAGAVCDDGDELIACDLKFPLAVVIGSEGKGIRPGILKHLDARLSLPMPGAKLSYNAGSAAALFCYEIKRKMKCL